MRKLGAGKNGVSLAPPGVEPCFNQRRTDNGMLQLITQVRKYELITPLFGGGVEEGVADPVTIIRGAGIRGQLRFWWRACQGGRFNGNLARMRQAEGQLWGAASTAKNPRPSQVQIRVAITNKGDEEQPFARPMVPSQGWRPLAYAAFPLQGDAQGRLPGKVWRGVGFTLTLTFPLSIQADVEAALWAWETFGGIGARTRRGFGALKLTRINTTDEKGVKPENNVVPPQHGQVHTAILNGLQMHVASGTWPGGVPHLEQVLSLKITTGHQDVRDAWEYLISRLKGFRQSRNHGATPGVPGRSRWPEPEEIRRLTGMRSRQHTPLSWSVTKFPRAAFGLPIVFHFKKRDVDDGDPEDTTLQGGNRDYERLASPLILRPMACAGGGAVGLALILKGTDVASLPKGLILKGAPGDPAVQASLTASDASLIAPLRGNVDVLQAFLDTL